MSIHRRPLNLARLFDNDQVCLPCLCRLSRKSLQTRRYISTTAIASTVDARPSRTAASFFKDRYFVSNNLWDSKITRALPAGSRLSATTTTAATASTVHHEQRPPRPAAQQTELAVEEEVLPHRRRRRRRKEEEVQEQEQDKDNATYPIPHDASSQLSDLSSTMPIHSLRQRALTYLSLSKPRLTVLMIIATTSAYSLYPVAVTPFSTALTLSPWTLLNLTTGTALSCACANALNMIMEPKYDAQMTRTRTRPLVRGLISIRGALVFAITCGIAGLAILNYGVNPTVAFLSGLNIFLYAGVYTPLKRLSTLNTLAGAVVGAIPPLMGWAAAASQQQKQLAGLGSSSSSLKSTSTSTSNPLAEPGWRELLFDPDTSPGGWLLAGLLFAWQFPHFNAISHTIRHEYAAAGYKMLASVNTPKLARIALRYSLLMFPICVGLSAVGVTSWTFAGTSSVVNGWMAREAWRFWRLQGGGGSARALFWASVWQLPLVLVLAMVQKKGVWERLVRGGLNEDELEEFGAE